MSDSLRAAFRFNLAVCLAMAAIYFGWAALSFRSGHTAEAVIHTVVAACGLAVAILNRVLAWHMTRSRE